MCLATSALLMSVLNGPLAVLWPSLHWRVDTRTLCEGTDLVSSAIGGEGYACVQGVMWVMGTPRLGTGHEWMGRGGSPRS